MPAGVRSGAGPTMRDVARAAGVSKALVSIVFRGAPGASEENRDRVFAAAERLGYRANRTASMLARSRTRQLGVVLDLRNAFHADVADGLLMEADRAGYSVVVSPWTANHPEQRAIGIAVESRCEALLLVGSELDSGVIASLAAGTPVVSIGRALGIAGADAVRSSDEAGMELVVDHLVARGHTRIVHVDGGTGEIAAARRAGFAAGLRRHDLSPSHRVLRGGRHEEDGARALRQALRTHQEFTAVAAFNDHCALGVIDALGEAGLAVGTDVSVTGYDDSPLARLRAIDLTSVRQEAPDLAAWAVAAAIERLDGGRTQPRETVLIPTLVSRGSSGAPPTQEAVRTQVVG